MLRYKPFTIPTISIFFRSKNDIDVFIEDTNDEEFYSSLLSRLENGKKITKIISCKCKTELIKACEADQSDRKRRRIYITDGDLELITDDNRKDLKYLYVLDRYCIENFLLDENGIIEILHSNIILDKESIKKQLTYSNFLIAISHPLIELFFHYNISHKNGIEGKTVSNSIGELCKQVKGITVLDIEKVESKIKEIRSNIIAKIGEDRYEELIYKLRQKWPSNVETLQSIVSAKGYILPLLMFRFRKLRGKESCNLKMESLRINLAKTCNLKSLDNLNKRMLNPM